MWIDWDLARWWLVECHRFLCIKNRVAAFSNCLHISLMSSSVWATIAASSANSSSRMQSSRVVVLAFSLANLNNYNTEVNLNSRGG